ncbi:MAG: DNA primase [Holosporaceae bacterium]|jgi:DNA primase|nr:DNA primase [Holosporaceae bacterium]
MPGRPNEDSMSRDFVDFLKSKISIGEVVSRRLKLQKSGKDFWGLCPFHTEKTASFRIDPDRGSYHCFGCGAHGDIITFVMEYENLSFPEALEHLANTYGIPLPSPQEKHVDPRLKIYAALGIVRDWFAAKLGEGCGANAAEYLATRNISDDSIKKFQLGFAHDGKGLQSHLRGKGFSKEELLKTGVFYESRYQSDLFSRFDGRLMFPISDAAGRCIGFGGRIIPGHGTENNVAKYINSPESEVFVKGEHLYGYHLARRGKTRDIILVEGYLDVIALHQSGFDGAVAPLGTSISEQQINLCWKITDIPTIALDGDSAGLKAAYRFSDKMLPLVSPGKSFRFARFPQDTDPDSLIFNGQTDIFRDAINNAVSLSQWLWDGSFLLHSSETPEQKVAVIKTITEKINLIRDRSIRYLYIQELRDREKKWTFKKNKFLSPRANIRPITAAKTKMEKILVVTLINHPHIIDRVSEDFVKLKFCDGVMENLKNNILECYGTHYLNGELGKYEAAMLELGLGLGLEKQLREDIELHAMFASHDASDDEALEGWGRAYERYFSHSGIKEDLQKASQSLELTFAEGDWKRLKALKKEMLLDDIKKRGKS